MLSEFQIELKEFEEIIAEKLEIWQKNKKNKKIIKIKKKTS